MKILTLLGLMIVLLALVAGSAHATDIAEDPPGSHPDENPTPQVESDPFAGFNEAMFSFNLKLNDYVLQPAARGYAYVVPTPVRESVGNFFDNVGIIPRFANNLFQLRLKKAGTEVARFGINSTLGVGGLFDVANKWFGLHRNPDDFGLTLRHYGAPTGPYLVLPVLGPLTVGDTVGRVADGAMNPLSYFVPWYVSLSAGAGYEAGNAVNYSSLHPNQISDVDRYAIDLYGAVQDGYLQNRVHRTKLIDESPVW